MYRFPWYLTLVSTNHASSNPGQGDIFSCSQVNGPITGGLISWGRGEA